MKVMDALGNSFRIAASDIPPSTAMTVSIREVTCGKGFCRFSRSPPSGSEGTVQPATNACTSGLFRISECAILLARSKGLRPLTCAYAMSRAFFGGEAIYLHRDDECIRVSFHSDEATVRCAS